MVVNAAARRVTGESAVRGLPDFYEHVARDVIRYCRPREGVWVDLGSGAGPVARALAHTSRSVLVLVDPDSRALSEALAEAEGSGLQDRFAAVVGTAEHMPLADSSVDLVVSRGSVFFWQDRPAGLREARRILRPGGKAMIGGGLGSTYPRWARQEFIRRRRENVHREGPDAVRAFDEARSPRTFTKWARAAGLRDFEVKVEGALLADDPRTGLGIWLLFGKDH